MPLEVERIGDGPGKKDLKDRQQREGGSECTRHHGQPERDASIANLDVPPPEQARLESRRRRRLELRVPQQIERSDKRAHLRAAIVTARFVIFNERYLARGSRALRYEKLQLPIFFATLHVL
ncbi:MAG: hypothetical protein IH944_02385 [Armatimonadetes bacterium]|nr:hypothetical protein [Armatimonadota bacterium]